MRELGYNVIAWIQLIRFFGFAEGCMIFLKIIFNPKNGIIKLKSKKFKNTVQIRKSDSDLPIFYQVFAELQYDINYYLKFKPVNIIDCGANVGYSSLFFVAHFPDANIIAIEPQKDNFKQLQENLKNYSNIKTVNAAIWDQNTSLAIKDETEWSASFEVKEQQNKSGNNSSLQGITITELMAEYNLPTIDILKIDIEGAEYNLFANNPHDWLNKTRCLIIELHDLLSPGTSQIFFKEMANYKWNTFIKGENIVSFRLD
ncbi:MAG: FkbM family methyltransferase [Chitinophagaceae bacterium]